MSKTPEYGEVDPNKLCRNCNLPLPVGWRRLQCSSSAKHFCWSNQQMVEWHNTKGIQTFKELGEKFLSAVHEVGTDMTDERKMDLLVSGRVRAIL